MHLPLILHLSYQGFQSEKSQLFNILTISLFRKSHSTLVGSAVLMKALYLQTVFSQVQRQVFPMLPNHLLCLPFIPTPTSQLEHLVHSTCSAMVCSIPEVQHNDGTESAGLWRPESVQDKFVACWCSSHSCIPPFSFVSAGGYPLQCQPGLPPTTANSALCSSLLCNYRSSSVDVRIEVSWSMLQLWFQKEVVLEWSQHYI